MAKAMFGFEDVHFARLSDTAQCLSGDEQIAIVELLDRLETRFPEVFFGVCFVTLPEQASLREFGFWLLNHAAVIDGEPQRTNENGAILTVDLTSRAAGFSLGYVLERFVTEADLYACLYEAQSLFARLQYGAAVERTMTFFGDALAWRINEAIRDPEAFARAQPMTGTQPEFEPIRSSTALPTPNQVQPKKTAA